MPRVSIAVVGAVLLAQPASAATLRSFTVGDWAAGAYSNDTTKEFNHCAGMGRYGSGISMIFAISRDFHWSMSFAHPAWRLRPGSAFDITFTVDDMAPITAQARAISPQVVEVELDGSGELFARFRRGYVLRVAAASQTFNFNLTGTSQLLPALLACAANRGAAVQTAANPFAPAAKPGGASLPHDAGATAEATALAANLLSAAGIQGFTLLGPNDRPEIKGDARWLQGDILGTINVMPYVPPGEFKNIPAYLIGNDAKACKGTFFSGAVPDDTVEIGRVFTTCQRSADDTSTVYYLVVPRRAGGAYLIATFAAGSEKPAKEADAQMRSAVFKAFAH